MNIHKKAFGINIISGNNPILNEILVKYDDIIGSSTEMSLMEKGYIFVFLKSTYSVSQTNNNDYIHESYFAHEIEEKPKITLYEQLVLNKLFQQCQCFPKQLIWVIYQTNP